MTPDDYRRTISKLETISEDKLEAITYSENMISPLSEEHKKLLESLQ